MSFRARAEALEAHAKRVKTDDAFQVAADAWEEAGDLERAKLMNALQPSEIAKRERAYRQNEVRLQESELREIGTSFRRLSRLDREGEVRGAAEAITRHPEILEERVRWLFDGTFGAGWMYAAQAVLGRSARSNRAAQLFQLVMAVDDRLPFDVTRYPLWRRLPPLAQANVVQIMEEALREQEQKRAASAELVRVVNARRRRT